MTLLNPYKPVNISQFDQTAHYGGAQHQQYPGLENQYSQYLPAATPAKSGSGLFSKLDFNQIKSTIDRMGGIDGILATVSKVQKVMQTMQQFGPVLRMLIPKLGAASANRDNDDYIDDYPRRRRRRTFSRRSGRRRVHSQRRRQTFVQSARRPIYPSKRPSRRRRY